MSNKIAIYTSNRAISLKKVASHVGKVLEKSCDSVITYVYGPNLDPEIVRENDGCIVIMPFDTVWCLPFFYIAWKFRYENKTGLFYTTIEGDPRRETHAGWIIRDLDFIANSKYTADKLRNSGVRISEVIPHGVDVEELDKARDTGLRLREELGLSNYTVVGYIASGHKRKCHDLFSKAVEIVEKTRDDIKFVIVTDEEGSKHYMNTNATIITSFGEMSEEEINSVINMIDIYAHGACSEGFGLPALEAVVAGKLVVIPDYSPLTEFVPEKMSVRVPIVKRQKLDLAGGIIFDINIYDPKTMAEKIIEASKIISERKIPKKVVDSVRRKYSIDTVYSRFVELLRKSD